MSIRRLAVFLAIALAVAVAIVGVAVGARPASTERKAPEPGSTVNRGKAIADARRRLRSFVPPPESRRVPALPKSLRLRGPGIRPASPRYVDVHAFWVSAESVEAVRSYLETHTPPGSRHSITSEAANRGGVYRWDYGYSWPELPNVADDRELLAGVVARPGGGSAIRVDAQATYVEPRPKGERIPGGAGYLEAEEVLGHKTRLVGTSEEARIVATTKLIDGFPILQRNGPEECGFIPSERVTLRGTFRRSRGGRVLATTEQTLPAGFCDYIGLTVRGKKSPRLLYDQGEGLVKALQGLLGRKYKKPLTAGIEGL
jgi:hypothetical protein